MNRVLLEKKKNQRIHAMEKSWIWVNTLFLKCEAESTPRPVDKKSGVPKEEIGVWGSQGGDRALGLSRRR